MFVLNAKHILLGCLFGQQMEGFSKVYRGRWGCRLNNNAAVSSHWGFRGYKRHSTRRV
jgi:hypothetical protein